MRTTVAILVGAVLLTGSLSACSGDAQPAGDKTTAPTSTTTAAPVASATLAAPAASGAQPAGVTYDATRVPASAMLSVASRSEGGETHVDLTVSGLLPNTKYGSHVHTKPCGAKPADSGPHYQHEKDPVTPSVDPKFANAQNEIWLDLTTDAKGDATATSSVKWDFRPKEANAVVIHAAHTSTEHGKAGTAGDRLACLTASF